MWRFARRTIHGILIVAGVSVFTFVLLSAAPGSFFDELKLNPQISPETVKGLTIQYGLDRPLPVRYEHWLASAARGEFGYSLSYRCAVGSLLWWRARNTLLLAGLATLLAWTIAVPWGVVEALHRGDWIDVGDRAARAGLHELQADRAVDAGEHDLVERIFAVSHVDG